MSRGAWLLAAALTGLALLLEPSAATRGLLALVAAGVLLWPGLASERAERRRTGLLVGLALISTAVAVSGRLPEFATSWNVRVWNVYHYYLGAKYFRELGYAGLYDATLRADEESDDYWRDVRRVRDLETYEVETRVPGSFEPLRSFTPERWEAFKTDVAALSTHRSARAWRDIFVDRGYNATPFWTVVGGGLASVLPAERPLALKLLCSLDLPLLAVTFWLVLRTFGLRAAAAVLLLLVLSPVNQGRFLGGFLQYDWFCAFLIGLCLQRRGRPVAAAAAIAYAVLTRLFPVLFVAAAMLPALRTRLRTGRFPRRALRLAVALSIWCALGFVASLANGRGFDGWRQFGETIRVHKEHHVFGERRVGLEHLFTHDWRSLDLDESRSERRRAAERQRAFYLASATLLVAAFLLVAWRAPSRAAMLLGLVPIYALFVSSRYYWSYLALVPLAGGRRGAAAVRMRWLAGTQAVILAGTYAFQAGDGDGYSGYVVFGALVLAYLVFALAALSPAPDRR